MAARPQSSSSFLGDIRSMAPDSLSDSFNSAPPLYQKMGESKTAEPEMFSCPIHAVPFVPDSPMYVL